MRVSSRRNLDLISLTVEASSVLRAPCLGTEVGAAGRVAAAVVGGGWGHHTAVTRLPTHPGHNFTLGIGHRNTSLQTKEKVKSE